MEIKTFIERDNAVEELKSLEKTIDEIDYYHINSVIEDDEMDVIKSILEKAEEKLYLAVLKFEKKELLKLKQK